MPGLSLKVEVEGVDEAASRLAEVADSIERGVGDALREVAELIVSEAQSNAPVDTGFLRDSIHVAEESDTSVSVVADAEYAAYVEYGTSRMAAQPFFEPAVENARAEIEQRLRDILSGNL